MAPMKAPPGFAQLCQGLHQDGLELANGSPDRLAADCTGFVWPEHRADLRAFLAAALEELSPAELKGQINRQKPDVRFKSDAAKAFFEHVLQHLD